MRAPCSLGEAEALRALLATAGFRDIRLHTMILTIRHAAVTEFLAGQLAATPVAAAVTALDATTRAALLNDICARLQPYMDEAGLAMPYAIHVAVVSAQICAVVSGCVMLRSQEARTSASPDRTEGHRVALPLPG